LPSPGISYRLSKPDLTVVYLPLDGLTNTANLHRRGANLCDFKCKALENIKNAGMPNTLEVIVVNGPNDKSIGRLSSSG
jgi:hypothetical protein